jgi:hypothetical protein
MDHRALRVLNADIIVSSDIDTLTDGENSPGVWMYPRLLRCRCGPMLRRSIHLPFTLTTGPLFRFWSSGFGRRVYVCCPFHRKWMGQHIENTVLLDQDTRIPVVEGVDGVVYPFRPMVRPSWPSRDNGSQEGSWRMACW